MVTAYFQVWLLLVAYISLTLPTLGWGVGTLCVTSSWYPF